MRFHKHREKLLLPDLNYDIPDNDLVWAITCIPVIQTPGRNPWRPVDISDMSVLKSIVVCPCSLWFLGAKPTTNYAKWLKQFEPFWNSEAMDKKELTGKSVLEIAEHVIFENTGRSFESPCVMFGELPELYGMDDMKISRRRI